MSAATGRRAAGVFGALLIAAATSARAVRGWSGLCALLIALGFTPLLTAQASEQPLVVVATVAKVTVTADGQEKLVEAEQAHPGDVLVYRATYTNRVARNLRNVVASMPIPPGLTYQLASAQPVAAEASVDGKAYFPIATPPEDVTPAQWRVVRWPARVLDAGTSFVVELRAQVNSNAAPLAVSR